MAFGKRDFASTRISLIDGAIHGHHDAITKLVEIYSDPLKARLSYRVGQAAAEQLVNEFIEDKFFLPHFDKDPAAEGKLSLLQRWDSGRCRFRSYVLKSLHHYATNAFIKRKRRREQMLPAAELAEVGKKASDELERISRIETLVQTVINQTLKDLSRRRRAMDVFQLGMLEPAVTGVRRTARELCEMCDEETVGAVYHVRRFIRKCFSQNLESALQQQFESVEERDELRNEIMDPKVQRQLSLDVVQALLDETEDEDGEAVGVSAPNKPR